MRMRTWARRELMTAVAVVAALLLVASMAGAAPAGGHAAEGAHGEEAAHGNPVIEILAKLVNFGLLAGTLYYFARSPLAAYLVNRSVQIRADLTRAAETRAAAAAQLAAVEQKLAALPGELEALRAAGAEEVAAEEARIREAAGRERERLLAQMRREIDLHGKAAERDLLRLAVSRAVAVATAEVTRMMTPADHARLADRYVEGVGSQAPPTTPSIERATV